MVLRFMFCFITICFVSCKQYAPMKMQRQEYLGKEFKIDGYYFNKTSYYYEGEKKDTAITTIVFYQNGFFSSSGFRTNELREVESSLIAQRGPAALLGGSGYYQVSGDSISIEFWTNASHFPIPTATVSGRILNDTTLKSKILGHHINDIWHFRRLSPKPDSTTIFDEQLEKGVPIKRGKKQKFPGIL